MTATKESSSETADWAAGASDGQAARLAWRLPWSFGSGPAVARLYQRLFALVSLGAWLSLGAQVRVLIGSRGLLPVEALMRALHASPDVSWLDLPTVFWRWHSDGALTAGIVLGVAASLAALVGVAPRLCFLVSTALYLSFVSVGRDFLSFQWDNLLLECGLLSVFLRPTARRRSGTSCFASSCSSSTSSPASPSGNRPSATGRTAAR